MLFRSARAREMHNIPVDERLLNRFFGVDKVAAPEKGDQVSKDYKVREAVTAQQEAFLGFREELERLHTRDFIGTSPDTGTGTRSTVTSRASSYAQSFVDLMLSRVENYRGAKELPSLTESQRAALTERATNEFNRAIEAANAPKKSGIRNFDALLGKTIKEGDFEGRTEAFIDKIGRAHV